MATFQGTLHLNNIILINLRIKLYCKYTHKNLKIYNNYKMFQIYSKSPKGIYNNYNNRKKAKNLNLSNIYSDSLNEMKLVARFD